MNDESLHEIRQSQVERYQIAFFCLLAVWCFGLGLYYWIRLAGVFPDENWRFDLMGWPWRFLSAALAVFYPLAACGLWLQSRWGIILWAMGGVSEAVCYLFLPSWFGANSWLMFIHLVFLLGAGAIWLYRYRFAQETETVMAEY